MYIASILMPVYNGERYLPEAIDSVLAQSFADFEFIIVDDGSTDNSPDIIRAYKDKRIRYIRLPQHMGISHALNHGLQYAEGELIFRMDADDFCFPQRIQCQINFMRQHPDVSICGSDTELIDEDGMVIGHRNVKEGDQRIKIALFLEKPALRIRQSLCEKVSLRNTESNIRNHTCTRRTMNYGADVPHSVLLTMFPKLWCNIATIPILSAKPTDINKESLHKRYS